MGCLLWVQTVIYIFLCLCVFFFFCCCCCCLFVFLFFFWGGSLIYIVPQALQRCMQYQVIKAPKCIDIIFASEHISVRVWYSTFIFWLHQWLIQWGLVILWIFVVPSCIVFELKPSDDRYEIFINMDPESCVCFSWLVLYVYRPVKGRWNIVLHFLHHPYHPNPHLSNCNTVTHLMLEKEYSGFRGQYHAC